MTENEPRQRRFMRHVKKHRLRYISITPALVTLINGLAGFAAIVTAARAPETVHLAERLGLNNLSLAAYLLIIAMIADMLDGTIARISKSTSGFGGQLDSLCDVISFGVAPAFLIYTILQAKLTELTLSPALETMLIRFIWLSAAAYLSCAIIRLARFNVENEEDESSHRNFAGLPTPAAAGVIVSLIIFRESALPDIITDQQTYPMLVNIITYLMPVAAFLTAGLMVSRIRYPHVINLYMRGKKPFTHLIWFLIALGLVIWSIQIALVVIFVGFALSGLIRAIFWKLHKPNIPPDSDIN